MNPVKRTISVLALVGTDHHPFDRMVNVVDELLTAHNDSAMALNCLIQYGTANPPVSAEGVEYLAKDEVHQEIERADLILCHGGPSTIVEILRVGKKPLVMPRDPERGEHVDGHQQRFARHMSSQGLVQLISSVHEIQEVLNLTLDGLLQDSMEDLNLPSPDESAFRLGEIVAALIAPAPKAKPWRWGWGTSPNQDSD